ncbi:ERF family protein [Trinickia mobilis]|uniref:ERF family protein n=1 Tax=Trinickia mobilis TaxID=2816356 RepID=UPI001A8CD735|nr:ERF family protein [Trinickia mobilis]
MADVVDMEPAQAQLPAAQPAAQVPRAVSQSPISITTPIDLMRFALQSGADLDRLQQLMHMQMEWEANEAKKSFRRAMAAFKAECPPIFKRKAVGYNTREGDFVGYKHAELSDVTDVVIPCMARHGLTHDWDIHQEPNKIIVECIVTHVDGHSKKVKMEGPPDTSGKKNVMQQGGSTVTYLERYSLLAALGMSTKGEDDDGAGGAEGDAGKEGNPSHQTTPAGKTAATKDEPAQADTKFYDQTKFNANKDAWREVVKSKRKTPAQMVKFIESKGAPLTENQKLTIDSWSHEND